MNKFSDGSKIGLTLCSQSYLVGGNWGYLSNDHSEYDVLLEMLRGERELIKLLHVSNGVIILGNTNVLQSIIAEVEPNMAMGEVNKSHQVRNVVEKNKCLKFFEEIVKGIDNQGNDYGDFTEYHIGIYSSNNGAKIRLNGIDYVAYKLTVQEIIECLKQLNRFKKVYVKVNRNGNDNIEFVKLNDILSEVDGLSAIIKALEISPTGTGVFITIRITK